MLVGSSSRSITISLKFNLKYKPKSFGGSKNLIRINCKMFFIFFLLVATFKNVLGFRYDIFKKTNHKWSFPRAPYKNKLSQITIGNINYYFYILLTLPSPLLFHHNVVATSSVLASFFLGINSPLLHTLRYNFIIPCVFWFEL